MPNPRHHPYSKRIQPEHTNPHGSSNSADFETYRHQRPTGRAAGEEIDGIGGVPYDRWNDGPPEMQSALYHAVSEIVTGRRTPPEWEGAVVKLLPKRAGEEHILQSNRPICLMTTAMKLVTGIWAHRLSKTAESLGHFESAQEGNRPARSTRRQTARLLLNLEAAKARQSSVFIAFLDLLWKSGLSDHDIAALK